MNSQLTVYIALICTSGVLNVYLGAYAYLNRHRYRDIAYFFMVYTASITIYCFGSAFGLLATSIEQIKFWTVIQYIGMPISTGLGLLFIINYLGKSVSKLNSIALLIIPLITLIAVATNDWHGLYYTVYELDPILGAPYLHQEIGIGYMVNGVYMFSCMLAAFLLAISHWKETATIYR